MPYTDALATESVSRATTRCGLGVHDMGCPVETRVENRLPEMAGRGMRDEMVEMALDAAHIGVFCSRNCPAVEPLLGIVRAAAELEAAAGVADLDASRSPVVRRLSRLPADASEPARHAFLLVRAAYRLRQARTAEGLWQAVDANLGCWIALKSALRDGRIVLPAQRRRQIVQYAEYVEQATRNTRPMSDSLVEAFIRLSRAVAVWLTETATDRVAESHSQAMAAAE